MGKSYFHVPVVNLDQLRLKSTEIREAKLHLSQGDKR